MPNGSAGDDWFTDIVAHDLPTFSPEADRLVKEIASGSSEPRPAALIDLVHALLEKVGYEELASRSSTVGMEYRNLRPEELGDLEHDLRGLNSHRPVGD